MTDLSKLPISQWPTPDRVCNMVGLEVLRLHETAQQMASPHAHHFVRCKTKI